MRILWVWIFGSKWKKSAMPVWSNFQIWGQNFSDDFIVPNDTEQTTEDILSVQTGYTTKIVKFIENFVSLDFWSEMKKICHADIVKFSNLVPKFFHWFFWFRIKQKGLLKTFYQCRLGIQLKFFNLLRILWVWIFGSKWKNSAMPVMVKFSDLGSNCRNIW